jgi:hypothetical protein
MDSLSGSLIEVNPGSGIYSLEQSYKFDPHERRALDQLRAELRAGKFHRCPKCLKWVNRKQHGAVMSHTLRTVDTNRPVRFVAFVICKRCFAEHLSTPDGPQKLVEALNSYFGTDEYTEVAK